MSSAKLIAASRGVDARFLGVLLVSLMVAVAANRFTVYLRGDDVSISGEVLDSAFLVGLAVPIGVLARTLQDRVALIAETASRHLVWTRLWWVSCVLVLSALTGLLIGLTAPPDQRHLDLLVADALLLGALATLSAVALGAALAWLAPFALAVCASTPHLIPISANVLVLADRSPQVAGAALVLAVLAVGAYAAFDDYGLARRRRLVDRIPGVNAD